MENNNKTSLDWLKLTLNKRREVNAAYSTRALARDLHISQTLISLILNGQRPLTRKVALKIMPGLELDQQEHAHFLATVELEQIQRKRNRKVYTRAQPIIHYLESSIVNQWP